MAFGVGLFNQFTKTVIHITPVAFVGVAHAGFAAEFVVDQCGAVIGAVGHGDQVALGVVAVTGGAVEVVGDANHFTQYVFGFGFVVIEGVGADGTQAVVGGGANRAVWCCGAGGSAEDVIVDAGPTFAGVTGAVAAGLPGEIGFALAFDAANAVVFGVAVAPGAAKAFGGFADAAAQFVEALLAFTTAGGLAAAIEYGATWALATGAAG